MKYSTSVSWSHLLQMRGLKHVYLTVAHGCFTSHLLQMRGLKQKTFTLYFILCGVASFTDAWIETRTIVSLLSDEGASHLLQMRGLKHSRKILTKLGYMSHLLQMRGLKPTSSVVVRSPRSVASFTDAWIETSFRARM